MLPAQQAAAAPPVHGIMRDVVMNIFYDVPMGKEAKKVVERLPEQPVIDIPSQESVKCLREPTAPTPVQGKGIGNPPEADRKKIDPIYTEQERDSDLPPIKADQGEPDGD